MDRKTLEKRTKKFHIDVIRICKKLPKDPAGYETAKQLIRSAGSVGATYRASKRAKSDADFAYKITVVMEEADESVYWMEVINESELLQSNELIPLIKEANELTSIFTATDKTIRRKLNS